MVTLIKRATKRQHMVWRIVKGAVRDAAHVHGMEMPRHFCESVAKRATGTLTAQWPDVLAAANVPARQTASGSPSGQSQTTEADSIQELAGQSELREADMCASVSDSRADQKNGRRSPLKRRPLLRLLKDAPQIMWWLKHNDPEAYAMMQVALSNVARTVGRLDAAGVD